MRRDIALALSCAFLLASIPSGFSQIRLDAGIVALKEIDLGAGDEQSKNREAFLEELPALPLPEVDISYQRELGAVKLGLGGRFFSLVAESMAWPNAYAELDTGRAAIDAQLGGGAFAMAGILNKAVLGAALIPELSGWLTFGPRGGFRVGGGIVGLYVPEILGEAMTVLLYFGAKVSFVF